MKARNLFYGLLVIFSVWIFSSCEKEDDLLIEEINPTTTIGDTTVVDPYNPQPGPASLLFIGYIGEEAKEEYKIPAGTDALHLMTGSSPALKSSNLKSSASFKSTAANDTYLFGFQNSDGSIDTLTIVDGSIELSGVEEMIPLTAGYIFIKGQLALNIEYPVEEFEAILDTISVDSIQPYPEYNLVEVLMVPNEMDTLIYNIYYDTIASSTYMARRTEYFNNSVLYKRGENNFYNFGDVLAEGSQYETFLNYFNDPFRIKKDKAFYYVNQNLDLIKVNLQGKDPESETLMNIAEYAGLNIIGDYIILKDMGTNSYKIRGITSDYTNTIGFPNSEPTGGESVLNDKMFFNCHDDLYFLKIANNGVELDSMNTFVGLFNDKSRSYKFESSKETVLYSEDRSYLIVFDKNTESFSTIDINGIQDNPDDGLTQEEYSTHRSMIVKDVNDNYYIHRAGKVFKVSNSSTNKLSEDFLISTMAAGESNINFYGIMKSNSKIIRGIINQSDEIEVLEEVSEESNFVVGLE